MGSIFTQLVVSPGGESLVYTTTFSNSLQDVQPAVEISKAQ